MSPGTPATIKLPYNLTTTTPGTTPPVTTTKQCDAEYLKLAGDAPTNFNVKIQCTNDSGGTLPSPASADITVTISANNSGNLQYSAGTATSFGSSTCHGGIRINAQGVNTSKIDFHVTGACAAGTGTVTKTGVFNMAATESAEKTDPGQAWIYGNISYKSKATEY